MLIHVLINGRGDDARLGEAAAEGVDALGRGDNVEEHNVLLLALEFINEDLHRADGGAAGGEHGVEEEDLAVGDVVGALGVVKSRVGCLVVRRLVTLNEDLADARAAARVAQGLLHRLTGAHNRNAADAVGRQRAAVSNAGGGHHLVRDDGELREALLHDKADEAVSIVNKVVAARVLVTDVRVEDVHLVRLRDEREAGVLLEELLLGGGGHFCLLFLYVFVFVRWMVGVTDWEICARV